MLNPLKQLHIFSCTVILFSICCFSTVLAGDYFDSAHGDGNAGNGVNRSSTSALGYAPGNCAHCHEQHASIEGAEPTPPVADGGPSDFLLYTATNPTSQTANFCFQCHETSGAPLQIGGIINYNYSTTFGGQSILSGDTTSSIKDAFAYDPAPIAGGSSHDLNLISTELTTNFGAYGFDANSNPCGGCHNPHIAKENNITPYDVTKAAISLPTDRSNLWGDDVTERMLAHATAGGGIYRAPFYVGFDPTPTVTNTSHEPDGQNGDFALLSPNVTGANTPDYSTFCLACHQNAIGTLVAIPWASGTNARHGQTQASGTARGNRVAPYTTDGSSGTGEDFPNYIMSCLDCHEPHGAKQTNGEYLLRTTVNGVTPITIAATQKWHVFCSACHSIVYGAGAHIPITAASNCNIGANCHGHDKNNF